MLGLYERADLIERAAEAARRRNRSQRTKRTEELAAVDVELRKGEEVIERYLLAFEAGTPAEATCAERLRALTARGAELRHRRESLAADLAAEPEAPTQDDLTALLHRLRKALATKPMAERKALMQALVHEVRVTSRADIKPVFRFPDPGPDTKVRVQARSAPPAGFEPAHPAPEAGALSPELRGPPAIVPPVRRKGRR